MKEPNRERKGEIKYNVSLNEEQKLAKSLILESEISIITGVAGTGKTLCAVQTAIDCLQKKMCDRIILTRSLVEVDNNTMGFLPGTAQEKLNPYLEAMMDNFEKCISREKIDNFIKSGQIKAGPLGFLRGKTISDTEICILDESQNTTPKEMEALLTRIGRDGKIIITGDPAQRDTKNGGITGLDLAINLSKAIPEIKHIKLKENHRSDIVGKILNFIYGR